MSTADTKTVIDDNFATKQGIEMVTPRLFAQLIEINAGSKTVVCAIGPSGVGKTAIPQQVAKKRNGGKGVPYTALFMPTATQEGFFIPTTAPDTKVYFDQRIPRTFQTILDWATAMEKKYGYDKEGNHMVPPDMCPILAIEELNRAVDKSVTRAAFTLIGDRMIGDVKLHPCIQIVATMNPSGGGMSVNEFERDPAMRRRLEMFGVAYNYNDFIQFAMQAKFHPHVIDHLGAQPTHGYDEMAALAGKAFACPATWESVSRTCYLFDKQGLQLNSTVGRAAIAGAIGTAATSAFLDFVRDNTMVITPEEVLTGYTEGSEIQKRFRAYLTDDGGRLDKVTDLTQGLITRMLADITRKPETIVKQIACYLGDLPEEIMMTFTQKVTDEANRMGTDTKNYLQTLNQKWVNEKPFMDALKRLHDAKTAAQKEAKGATTTP